jgi:hypothetical protein
MLLFSSRVSGVAAHRPAAQVGEDAIGLASSVRGVLYVGK